MTSVQEAAESFLSPLDLRAQRAVRGRIEKMPMLCGYFWPVFAIGTEGGKTEPPKEGSHGKPVILMDSRIIDSLPRE
jgi:hypothetical protein